MTTFTARSGPRSLVGLLAALGLVGALAMPALANHETDFTLVSPGAQSTECDSYDYGFKLDNMDSMSAGVYTASDAGHTVWIEIELFESGNEVNDYEILDADPEIAFVFVKQPVQNGGISHLTFCYDVPESIPAESIPAESIPAESIPAESIPAESIPAESIPAESIPAESIPAESIPAESIPAESVREGELGGNPTPSGGGTLPDTAMGEWGQIPATVLSLLLLGSLAGMLYVRLARQR
ncbi:hypothetical protein BH24ACT5_BH24ACT5_19770 [soil metagenome]